MPMRQRSLYMAVIEQAIADLTDPCLHCECLEFFHGPRFGQCCELAGLGREEVQRILSTVRMIRQSVTMTCEAEAQEHEPAERGRYRDHIRRPEVAPIE